MTAWNPTILASNMHDSIGYGKGYFEDCVGNCLLTKIGFFPNLKAGKDLLMFFASMDVRKRG